MKDYFIYLKNAVSLSTRLAYLEDIEFFLKYLINNDESYIHLNNLSEITIEQFSKLKARDINYFIGEYCTRYLKSINGNDYLFKASTSF